MLFGSRSIVILDGLPDLYGLKCDKFDYLDGWLKCECWDNVFDYLVPNQKHEDDERDKANSIGHKKKGREHVKTTVPRRCHGR